VTVRLRLQPAELGWVDVALGVPLMSTYKYVLPSTARRRSVAAGSREQRTLCSGVRVLVGVAQCAVVVFLGVKRHFRVCVLGSPLGTGLTGTILRGVLGLLWSSFSVLWRFVVHSRSLPARDADKPVTGLEAPIAQQVSAFPV
jgi:hypothetical protein